MFRDNVQLMVDNAGRVTFQPLPSYIGRSESVKRVDHERDRSNRYYQAEVGPQLNW